MNLAVIRSAGARTTFVISVIITALILLWDNRLLERGAHGLSPVFYLLFTLLDSPAAVWMLLALLVAALVCGWIRARSIAIWISDHCSALALATAALFSISTLVVYRNHPFAMDEYAMLFQSKVFAAGHLTGRFPPALLNWLIARPFQDYFLNVSHVTGQVASSYWPSFSLLLTPFTFLHMPWACNPVIAALTILAIHRLTLLVFEDREAAGYAVLLTLASPVFFADGISYYSMAAHLLANTLYAILLVKPTARRALVAGIVGSIALTLHNPVPHLLFAIPWLFWLARREGGVKLFAWISIGYLPLCLVLGFGWFFFSIHLKDEGMHAAAAVTQLHALRGAFGGFVWPTSRVLFIRTIDLAKMWLWAVPGLLIVAVVGAWKTRGNPACRLLVASAVVTLVGYLFVPFDQGHGWGDRYFHSAWMVLPILAAGALTRRGADGGTGFLQDKDSRAFVVACALAFLVAGVGLRATQIRSVLSFDVAQLPAYRGTQRRVVFVDTRNAFYGADLVQNDPWLRGNEIRMLNQGTARDVQLMKSYFPSFREVYADKHGAVWAAPSPLKAEHGQPN